LDFNGDNDMRLLKVAFATVFAVASTLAISSVGQGNSAEAKAHVTPGKPGSCGPGKFYSKKDKGCVAK
jgi:hypothetical protein